MSEEVSLAERYEACMVLAGVGDALGYRNGRWEFCMSGKVIHEELEELGGLKNITLSLPDWMVSDDTVMHLATAEALVAASNASQVDFYHTLAAKYKECMNDMMFRAEGDTCSAGAAALRPQEVNGWQLPFNPYGKGCGAAMRAMCIGLRYPREEDEDDLIRVSVEAGRMTHHHPTGYLGSLATALFTAYAVRGREVRAWGFGLMDVLPRAMMYMESQQRYVAENKQAWLFFETSWYNYLKLRGILDGRSEPLFPEEYGVEERDAFYTFLSARGWGGSCGHDAPMIAYDGLLGCGGSWNELCHRAMLHGGDNDSTGTMAGAWYGALYGYHGVPAPNHQCLEYKSRLVENAASLLKLSRLNVSLEPEDSLSPLSTEEVELQVCEDITQLGGQEKSGTVCEDITQAGGQEKSGTVCEDITQAGGQEKSGTVCEDITQPGGQEKSGTVCEDITQLGGQEKSGTVCEDITQPGGQEKSGTVCEDITQPGGQEKSGTICEDITQPGGQEKSGTVCEDITQPGGQEKSGMSEGVSLAERYEACMVLGGVGDALGYRNGRWEFCKSGARIHKELEKLGGLENITLSLPDWMVSDDTVMHLATAEALVAASNASHVDFYCALAAKYKRCMNDMESRAAGVTCSSFANALMPRKVDGWQQSFNPYGGGCGAAMRTMCIGLRYPREEDEDDLIRVSVEAGRMTHHHPTGYLGSLATALFTAYAVRGREVRAWGCGLMEVLPRAMMYVESQQRYVAENKQAWSHFETSWYNYLKLRGILDGCSEPVFPEEYGVAERDAFYKSVSFSGWGGASGHDAPMIAYDGLLGCGGSWKELCERAMLHGGDNDSTGTMAGAWYGALYGYHGVPAPNYQSLEYRSRLVENAVGLQKLSTLEPSCTEPASSTIDSH